MHLLIILLCLSSTTVAHPYSYSAIWPCSGSVWRWLDDDVAKWTMLMLVQHRLTGAKRLPEVIAALPAQSAGPNHRSLFLFRLNGLGTNDSQ